MLLSGLLVDSLTAKLSEDKKHYQQLTDKTEVDTQRFVITVFSLSTDKEKTINFYSVKF